MSDTKNKSENKPVKKPNNATPPPNMQIWMLVSVVAFAVGLAYFNRVPGIQELNVEDLKTMIEEGEVRQIVIVNDVFAEITLTKEAARKAKYRSRLTEKGLSTSQGPHFRIDAPRDYLIKRLDEIQASEKVVNKISPKFETRHDFTGYIFNTIFLFALLAGLIYLMRRMTMGAGGGQIFNIGKSKAALFDADKVKITFKDVAGLDEAKEEVEEVVQFLKNPGKYTNLGGKIPKGVLLVGPPGTGKTLLAKAVAGESGVPFFSLSGSDFVEMFVGVGAARVRDLFRQAKEKAPCIIFIDEIDAIGRMRGRGAMPGANDERENTLNSLLVEMDGFATDSGVIIMAATNRPDVLDSALLRPGRFDRLISIDKPDVVGREAIFKVHLAPLKLAPEVSARELATRTPGFAGAEIANVCNEAALIAARKDKSMIETKDFEDAIDRVIGGLEKKNKIISPEEREIVAFHEAGHAIAGWFLEHANPLIKVSIVPRGVAALGYAQYLPKEQFLHTTEMMIDEICTLLGGRAAEDIIFGKISTGALSDLERVTKLAYSMVTIYGMNPAIGNISFYEPERPDYFGRPYSEATAEKIDNEVKAIVESAYLRTKDLLQQHKEKLENLAKELLEKEIIFQKDLERILGARPKESNYQKYMRESEEKDRLESQQKDNNSKKEALPEQTDEQTTQ